MYNGVMTQTLDREARRAALLARRSDWKPTEELTVTAADVVVGDFIVSVPRQANARGVKVEAIVAEVKISHDSWGVNSYKGGRRFPVESRVIHFNDDHGTRWAPKLDVPSTFKVVVRREVSK